MEEKSRKCHNPSREDARDRSFVGWLRIHWSWMRRRWAKADELRLDCGSGACNDAAVWARRSRKTLCRCRTIRGRRTARQSCWRNRGIHPRGWNRVRHRRIQIPALVARWGSRQTFQSVECTRTRRLATQVTPAPCRSRNMRRRTRW